MRNGHPIRARRDNVNTLCCHLASWFFAEDVKLLERAIAMRWADLEAFRRVSPPLIAVKLLVSGEDHRNGRHSGIDLRATARAMWRTVWHGRREGGSTIEQQLVRVLTRRYEPTLRRKIREMVLAVTVARRFEKRLLATVYLDAACYGWRMNGFAEACQRLAASPTRLDLITAAALVARLKYPQPKQWSDLRMAQIEGRAKHLLSLHERHKLDLTYAHLGVHNGNPSVHSIGVARKNFVAESTT